MPSTTDKMALNLTPNHFLHNEESLRSKIVTNLGMNACRLYNILNEDIRRTNGLARDAAAKIVIRDMRLSASLPFGRKNYQENLHYIYIWPDLQTTKLPDKYEEAITEWLGELREKYATAGASAGASAGAE
jgi:hypothetical protein